MKILVTGATGGLGRNILESFSSEGHTVTATGRNKNIGSQLQGPNVVFKAGDLSDLDFVQNLVPGHDALVHCAALAAPIGLWDDFYQSNVVATENLLRTSIEAGGIKRFVHISTPSIYHNGKARTNIQESDELPHPSTFYAKTKLMAEEKVFEYIQKGLPAIILRPRALYGKYDQVLLPQILKLLDRGFFPLLNKGNALVDITYIGNVVEAVRCALTSSPESLGQAYNITNGEPMTMKNIISLLSKYQSKKVKMVPLPVSLLKSVAYVSEKLYLMHVTKNKPLLTTYGVDLLSLDQTLSIKKAKDKLNYKPQFTIEDGLKDYFEWRNFEANSTPI